MYQLLNCWNDGVPMVTQRPIPPNANFTYRFDVAGQEGTLWWHAHDAFLRATVYGALIIRPRNGAASYPFPKPHKEIPILIGFLFVVFFFLVIFLVVVFFIPILIYMRGRRMVGEGPCSGGQELHARSLRRILQWVHNQRQAWRSLQLLRYLLLS